jgi:hypothetical protein
VGRASNRKKARRQAASPAQQAVTTIQAQAKRQLALVDELNGLNKAFRRQAERYLTACRTWCGGSEPEPARSPRWAHGLLGRQVLASKLVAQAADGPCLRTAEVPEAAVILGDPAHWNVATRVLVRAVVFDGLKLGEAAVSALLDVLTPVVTAELSYHQVQRARRVNPQRREATRPMFPVLDGPALLLGMGVLADVTRALVGDNPQFEELAVLSRGLDGAIPGVPGSVVADALVDAVSGRYLRVLPPELLQHIDPAPIVNPLEILAMEELLPGDALRAGLAILSSVVVLCENDALSTGKQVA